MNWGLSQFSITRFSTSEFAKIVTYVFRSEFLTYRKRKLWYFSIINIDKDIQRDFRNVKFYAFQTVRRRLYLGIVFLLKENLFHQLIQVISYIYLSIYLISHIGPAYVIEITAPASAPPPPPMFPNLWN